MKQKSQYNTPKNKEEVDVWKVIYPYIIRWPWYIISILFFALTAWVILRYSTPVYSSSISILLKDTKASINPVNSLIENATSSSSGEYTNIVNDIEVLKSVLLLSQVVERLGINHIYKKEGKIKEGEVYSKELPIILQSKKIKGEKQLSTINFQIEYNFPNIILKDLEGNKIKSVKVNQSFDYGGYKFSFILNKKANKPKESFKVRIIPIEQMAYQLQNNLNITFVNDYSTVIKMTYNSSNPKEANDILNELVSLYNKDAISDKRLEFDKTQEFINERIAILDNELGGVENKLENFKKSNDFISIESESEISISEKNTLESKLLEADTNLSLLNSYKNKVLSENMNSLLPQDILGANNTVSAYNQLVLKKQELISEGAKQEFPTVKQLTENIKSAKQQVLATINQREALLKDKRSNIIQELNKSSSIKSNLPTLEKTLRDIGRQQQIKESLYLILLQKREEAAISSAITQEKAKIVDPAKYRSSPIKPKKTLYYLGATLLGLLLPIGIIYLKELLRNKIENREDLEDAVLGYPIVAELPSFVGKNNKMLVQNDLSTISEAFRIMRTNLNFVLSGIKKKSRGYTILVTSSIKGEGKTFVAMNYAHILGQIKNNKVILIGADIRNPQLHRFTDENKNIKGLTDYLCTESNNYNDFIHISKCDDKTHIMFSGRIPPNPTELLMSDKFHQLIKDLCNEYDYIVIDSAPLLLVSDTLNIGKYMDLTIFVTRSKFTPKDIISIPLNAVKDKRLNQVAFVLNDVSSSHSGYAYGYKYNYGYGYGYGQKRRKKRFLEKLKDRLFR